MENSKFISLTGTFVETDSGFVSFGNKHDAKLFADALTTIQKCDLLPSELLAQRDELLIFIKSNIIAKGFINQETEDLAKQLINKIKSDDGTISETMKVTLYKCRCGKTNIIKRRTN